MSTIPLFIHSPVSDSVMQALPFVKESEAFYFHTLKMDPDLFALLIDVRPCVAIFSIPAPEQTRQVCGLLESFRLYRTALGYPQRDPTLRIILVAEQRAVAIERWHELGVHEFIIAPILPRALAFKVARHHQRAIVSQIPEPVIETEEEYVIVREKTVESSETQPAPFRVIQTQLVPVEDEKAGWRFRTPERNIDKTEIPIKKIEVVASLPELPEKEGRWIQTRDTESPEEIWNWSWNPPKDQQTKRSWTYRGERPVYDRKHGGWKLRGEKPDLVLKNEKGQELRMVSVEETENGTEVIIDDSIDVQDVSERAYTHHAHREPAKGPYSLGLGTESQARTRKWGSKDSVSDEDSSVGGGPARTEEPEVPGVAGISGIQRRVLSTPESETEAAKQKLGKGDPYSPSSTQSGGRMLMNDPAQPRSWQSLIGSSEKTDSAAEDQAMESSEDASHPTTAGRENKKASHETSDPADLAERPGDESNRLAMTSRIRQALSGKLDEPSDKKQTGIEEAGPEFDSTDSQGDENIENHPLIARLEAALMGKEPPVPSGAHDSERELDSQVSDILENPENKGVTLKSLLNSEEEPNPGKDLRLDARETESTSDFNRRTGKDPSSERTIRVKSSDPDPNTDPHFLKTKEVEANTWSMQNLDESGALGKAKRIPKHPADLATNDDATGSTTTIDADFSISALATDEPNAPQAPEAPMDPKEKARLLKKVYESLDLNEKIVQEKPGFLSKIIEKLLSYLKGDV